MKTAVSIVTLAMVAGTASAQVDVFSSSFEGGDAAGFEGTGDWELGIPTGFDAADFGGPEPVGGNTGDYAWGTIIGGQHNPNTFSTLSRTVDLTGITDASLTFFEWLDSGGNTFDMATVVVNGEELTLRDGGPTGAWREVTLDLSQFDGQSSVDISFNFETTGVVERVGWYIDDVSVTGVPAPGSLALLGLGGLAATRRRR